ncbi:hypothetical protein SAMN05444166_0673 [Singulisphaera sp. GP187]|uniref:hypothetical protein n=1 Tax=Singulisphaera sp. GP187 TaxID=1882752 RepID=UPI00092BF5F4|nr:hypothetical protein [Singulisphaera sp. GP187]SIN75776.1 hypothetical protein SAMN05444166_0673 [Singulisphaera sp. GP187]
MQACLIRFVVHQKLPGFSRQVGLFSAAGYLRDQGELDPRDRARLDRTLSWFSEYLYAPPADEIPSQAIFWYYQDSPLVRPMWALANILKEYNFSIELIKTNFAGLIVYKDEHQVAAIPRGGKR